MSNELMKIDLKPIIDKLRDFKIIDINKFNSFLGDATDYIFEASDHIAEAKKQLKRDGYKSVDDMLKTIQIQLSELKQLLIKMDDYDSKYMYRLWSSIESLEEDINEELN